MMAIKRYRLYCQHCHYNRFTDGTDVDDLVEVSFSKVQGNIPYLDPMTKKTVIPEFKKRPKRFKCPDCGRMITPKKLEEKQDEKKHWTDGSETGSSGQEI